MACLSQIRNGILAIAIHVVYSCSVPDKVEEEHSCDRG